MSGCNFEKCIHAVKESFFGKDNIIKTAKLIIAEQADRCQDPITDVIIMIIKSSFSPALTDIGFMPFSLHPTHVIPYSLMSKEQLEVLLELCAAFGNSARYISCNQMGGGVFVGCMTTNSENKCMIDPALAIFACSVVVESSLESNLRKDKELSELISNVILQRILASVNISRERITKANEMKIQWTRDKEIAHGD